MHGLGVPQVGVGDDGEPAGGTDRPRAQGRDGDLVGRAASGVAGQVVVGTGEDLERARQVEALHAVERDEEDGDGGAARHEPIVAADDGVRNDRYPTFPAIAARSGASGGAGAGHAAPFGAQAAC